MIRKILKFFYLHVTALLLKTMDSGTKNVFIRSGLGSIKHIYSGVFFGSKKFLKSTKIFIFDAEISNTKNFDAFQRDWLNSRTIYFSILVSNKLYLRSVSMRLYVENERSISTETSGAYIVLSLNSKELSFEVNRSKSGFFFKLLFNFSSAKSVKPSLIFNCWSIVKDFV